MMCHGHERWHPAPEFYYKKGGGPMFDMGPYYLTALVSMIGPVSQVCGMTSMSFPERMITSQPKYGELIKVEVPTHVCGIMRFKNGAIGNIITIERTSVVSVQTLQTDMARVAYEMDDTYGIMTRVGLHCAPSAHKTLGTYPEGTIRFSFGPENTHHEVDLALHALAEITGSPYHL